MCYPRIDHLYHRYTFTGCRRCAKLKCKARFAAACTDYIEVCGLIVDWLLCSNGQPCVAHAHALCLAFVLCMLCKVETRMSVLPVTQSLPYVQPNAAAVQLLYVHHMPPSQSSFGAVVPVCLRHINCYCRFALTQTMATTCSQLDLITSQSFGPAKTSSLCKPWLVMRAK